MEPHHVSATKSYTQKFNTTHANNTGLFEMTVRVLTTYHTQCT